jgi:hypothetical protein
MTLVGYKGLLQGSVLSYKISLSLAQIDLSQPAVVFSNLVVYVTHRLIEVAFGLIQTACTSLGVFFSSMRLTISSSKSEVMLFSQNTSALRF